MVQNNPQTPPLGTLGLGFVSENRIIDVMQYLAPLGSSDHVGVPWKLKYGCKEKIRSSKIQREHSGGVITSRWATSLQVFTGKRNWKARTLTNAGRASRDNIWKRRLYVYRMLEHERGRSRISSQKTP